LLSRSICTLWRYRTCESSLLWLDPLVDRFLFRNIRRNFRT